MKINLYRTVANYHYILRTSITRNKTIQVSECVNVNFQLTDTRYIRETVSLACRAVKLGHLNVV